MNKMKIQMAVEFKGVDFPDSEWERVEVRKEVVSFSDIEELFEAFMGLTAMYGYTNENATEQILDIIEANSAQ